jgi:hypothetical protein
MIIAVDYAAKMLCILLPLFSTSSPAAQRRLTQPEARRLALAAMPKEAKTRAVTVELDHEHNGCAIYHEYTLGGSAPYFNTATLGWWSVDLRTGEVWNEHSERVTNSRLVRMQRGARKHHGVRDGEVSAAVANPCDERYSK